MSVKEPRTEPRVVHCYYCENEMSEPGIRKASSKNSDVKFYCGECRIKPKKKVKLIKRKVKSCLRV